MNTKNQNEVVLNEATKQAREVYTDRAIEFFMNGLVYMRKQLSDNGMDLNKVAPYPASYGPTFRGTKQYKIDLALHREFNSCFETADKQASYSLHLRRTDPWIVKEKSGVESKRRKDAVASANACFDSFVCKMLKKIGVDIISATFTGIIWDGCTLTVQCADGTTQVWNTKCILNQSVYGKLFNQWPTRRVS